jgi:hypothetical protein
MQLERLWMEASKSTICTVRATSIIYWQSSEVVSNTRTADKAIKGCSIKKLPFLSLQYLSFFYSDQSKVLCLPAILHPNYRVDTQMLMRYCKDKKKVVKNPSGWAIN